jgi:hypothetical protein
MSMIMALVAGTKEPEEPMSMSDSLVVQTTVHVAVSPTRVSLDQFEGCLNGVNTIALAYVTRHRTGRKQANVHQQRSYPVCHPSQVYRSGKQQETPQSLYFRK